MDLCNIKEIYIFGIENHGTNTDTNQKWIYKYMWLVSRWICTISGKYSYGKETHRLEWEIILPSTHGQKLNFWTRSYCNGSHIFLHSLSCIFFVLMTLVFLSNIFEIHGIWALLHVHKALELILNICFWVFHDGLVVFLLREVMKGNEIQLTTKTSRAVNLALFGQAASWLEAYLS